ncbi:MAG: hypothetical protein IJP26_02455 [Clostridia bacterium]|nr:hypothetical protein [Clostridia bacterium]
MKKICLIILCFALCFLCSCNKQNNNNIDDGKPTIVMPDYNTQLTVNGYKTPDSNQNKNEVVPTQETYYANKSSKKFHKSSCSYAKNIKEENLYITNNLTELIDGGYQACKQCKP